jgi:hypothetical protein
MRRLVHPQERDSVEVWARKKAHLEATTGRPHCDRVRCLRFAIWRFVDRAAPASKPWTVDSCAEDYLGTRRTYSVDEPWCTIEVESI